MKILRYIFILVLIGVVLYFSVGKKEIVPVNNDTDIGSSTAIELCFGKFGQPNERGFADVYTLRMTLDGTRANGELKFLPAEKDSKVGTFMGTVSPVDKVMMARTMQLIWDTHAEGMNTSEELKIIFGEGTASIGLGEMVDRGGGTYIYKDPTKVAYTLNLSDIACSDLNERENVDTYLRKNIGVLSPVKAVLGGTWYVVGDTIDFQKNSGTVAYEDGHIQQKKDFTYTVDEKNTVISLHVQ